jgi:GntR family transcriptional regulator, sialic acid-inducible nan operon repressor
MREQDVDTPLDLGALKTAVSKLTIREQVSERIAAMVQSGLLREGDELPSERELASTLGVSRETVRSAIQMLAARGMVEISQGSRTRVLGAANHLLARPLADEHPSQEDERTVYEARRLVELPTIRLAVRRIEPGDLLRLQRLVEAQHSMTADPVRFQISDAEFHALIYKASGNKRLARFLQESYSFGLAYRRRVLLAKGAVQLSLDDHVAILDGFERQDPDAAAEAMERHLDRIHSTTMAVMR